MIKKFENYKGDISWEEEGIDNLIKYYEDKIEKWKKKL